MTTSPEVLLYILTLKNFIEKNEEAKSYFLSNGDEKKFMEYATKLSQKNFETNGEPNLTPEQFEEIRDLLNHNGDIVSTIFLSFGKFGMISLN